jgi:hypothetical protein
MQRWRRRRRAQRAVPAGFEEVKMKEFEEVSVDRQQQG